MMQTCPACGEENRPGARFCRSCGYLLAAAPEGAPGESQPATPTNPAPNLADPGVPDPAPLEPLVNPATTLAFPPGTFDPPAAEPQAASRPESVAPPDAPPDPPGSDTVENSAGENVPVGEPPLPAALSAGTMLAGRYRIQALLEGAGPAPAYTAEDLLRCASCGAAQSDPGLQYCEACGVELSAWPVVWLLPCPPEGSEAGERLEVEGACYQVSQPAPAAAPAPQPVRLQLVTGYQSDTGRQREIDEDSLLVIQLNGLSEMQASPALGFFAVADGIGGHEAGEVASRAAIRSLAAQVLEKILLPELNAGPAAPEELAGRLVEVVRAANQAVLDLRQARGSDMGSTLTAALVRDGQVFAANVGDSRTYHMNEGRLRQVTTDHSVVARLVEQGLIGPEEIYTHEQKGVIYRSLGDQENLVVDTFQLELKPGDRLLLCCDGLWEMVRDPLIEDLLLESFEPQRACDRLVEYANLAGGEDNISVIVVSAQALPYARRG